MAVNANNLDALMDEMEEEIAALNVQVPALLPPPANNIGQEVVVQPPPQDAPGDALMADAPADVHQPNNVNPPPENDQVVPDNQGRRGRGTQAGRSRAYWRRRQQQFDDGYRQYARFLGEMIASAQEQIASRGRGRGRGRGGRGRGRGEGRGGGRGRHQPY